MSLKAQARRRVLFLLGLLLLVTLGIGGWIARHVIHERQRFAVYRHDGLAAAQTGDNEKAVTLLGRYLMRTPDDIEALEAFSNARPKVPLPKNQQIWDTVHTLQQLVRLDPNRVDDQRRLMNYYQAGGLMTEANAAADELLSRVPGDPAAMTIKISALIQLHKYKEALDAANARVGVAPQDWYAQLSRFEAMSKTGGKTPAQMMDMANQLAATHPDDQGALMLVGMACQLNGDGDHEKTNLRAAATRPAKDANVANLLIRYLDQSGLHVDAMVVLASMAKTGDVYMEELYLRRLWEDGRLQEAAELAGGPAAAALDDVESQAIYADALRALGRTNEAAKVRQKLADRKDDPIAAAWLAIEAAEISRTRDSARAVRAACDAAQQRMGTNPYLIYFQGVADAALGDTGAAIDQWKKAGTLQYTWARPMMLVAQAELNQGHPDQASSAAAEAIRRAPGSPEVAVVQSMIWFAQVEAGDTRHLGDLSNLIDEIQGRYKGEEATARMRVSLLGRAGKNDQAVAALKAMLEKKPTPSEKTLLALVAISRQWNLGEEDDCLKLMQDAYGKTPESVLTDALDNWKRAKDDTGLKLLESAVSSSSGPQRISFRLAETNYLEMIGDAGATTAWVALGDQFPDDLNVQRGALTSAAAYRDRDFYDRTIDRARQLLGEDSTAWRISRARWLLDGSDDPKSTADAITLLQDVLHREPTSMGGNILMGMAKAKSGDMAGATAQIAAAQRLDPKSRVMALDMAKLLQYRGDFSAAAAQIDLVVTDPKSTPTQLAQAAAMLAGQGNITKAISVLEPVVANPAAPAAYRLQLASLYCRVNQLDKAQAIADELAKTPGAGEILLRANIQMLKGQVSDVDKTLADLDALKWQPGDLERTKGDLRFSFGQLNLSFPLLKAATVAAPKNPSNWLDLMQCEVAMGKMADLTATVAEAGKQLPDNATISGIAKQADLIAHAGDGQTQQQLVSAVLRDPSPTGPAVTTLSVLENVVSSGQSAAEILQKVQNLGTDLPRFLPAQIVLAEVQLRLGRCADAVQSANRAVDNFPTEARPAELATMAMSSNEQWDDALQMARIWKSRMLGNTTPADLQIAQIQVKLADSAGALTTLTPVLAATNLTPDQKWQAQMTQALALARQGKNDDAVKGLWPTVKTTPAVQQMFLGFVSNNLPPAQAEPWLNQLSDVLRSQPNSEQAQLALATTWDLLASRSSNKQYEQNAHTIIDRLEQIPSISGQAYLTEGILADQIGDTKAAEAAYRKALTKADLPEAKNNLAMVAANSGDIHEAIDLARQCVKSAPNQAAYYDTLAYILGKAKKYDDAVTAMQTAMHLEPDNAKWHINLAKILLTAGKFNQAKQQIAELDLMTPGVQSLKDFPNYLSDLDAVRKQLAAGPRIP